MDVSIITMGDVLRASVPVISLEHNEGEYTIYAELPGSCDILTGDSLGFKDIDGRYRLFEITSRTLVEPDGVWQINGVDKAIRELMDEPITEYRARGVTVTAFVTRLLQDTRFSLGTVTSVSTGTMTAYYESVWSALVKVQETFNVLITPYYVFSGGVVSSRLVDIRDNVADYRGRIFELGDDLTGIDITYDDSQIKTALYGRGRGVEIGGGEDATDPAYGRRLTFADEVWTTAGGDPADKPLGQEWIGDPAALALYGRGGRHRFGYVVFDDVTEADVLLERTWERLQQMSVPIISIRSTVQDTERLLGRGHEAVRMGDMVIIRMTRTVGDKKVTTDITARVIEVVRDYVMPEQTKLTIGNAAITSGSIINSLTETVDNYEGRAAVWDRANAFDINGIMDVINNQIMSSVGHWYTDPETGAIMLVTADESKAMRLTGAGWQIADSKVGGVWQWRTAATGSGIVADQITTGTLNAGLVTVGGTGTTLDGTSLEVMHPSISNTAKTIIDASGLRMMESGIVLGGLLRKSQDLIISAVQALWNPQNQNQYVKVTPGLYEGEEDGLAFYGGYTGGQFVQGLGAALTWNLGAITLRALNGVNSHLFLGQSFSVDCSSGMSITPKPNYKFDLGYYNNNLLIRTPNWDISESSNGRRLTLSALNENCSISMDKQTGNISFSFIDSNGNLSRLTIREIDDGISHG